MTDDEIRALLVRLARSHPSGGHAVERAALLAAGPDFPQVLAWITDHDGHAEAVAPAATSGGLHGSRVSERSTARGATPLRYVLGAGVLA